MPETKDLILEKAVPADWEDMYRNVWSRPACCRYMFWDLTVNEADARDRMARTIRWQETHDAWIIREKAGGRVIGFTGVVLEDPETAEEQGVCLCPEYWRKGYGTQVLQALMAYAQTQLHAKRFVCRARKENTASRKLIEKEGFSFLGEETVSDHRDGRLAVLVCYEKALSYGEGLREEEAGKGAACEIRF